MYSTKLQNEEGSGNWFLFCVSYCSPFVAELPRLLKNRQYSRAEVHFNVATCKKLSAIFPLDVNKYMLSVEVVHFDHSLLPLANLDLFTGSAIALEEVMLDCTTCLFP